MAGPVVQIANLVNRPLLRWGIHPARGSTFLLQVTGRRSGQTYDIPLWYISRGDTLFAFARRRDSWWKNLKGNAPVDLWLRGRRSSGMAHAVVGDPSEIAPILSEFLDALRWRTLPTYFGIRLDVDQKAANGEIERASREEVAMIRVDIDS